MSKALDIAFEISYYAGKLWGVITDPDIAEGNIVTDYTKILVPKYAEPEDGKTLLTGQVASLLREKFTEIAEAGVPESDSETRGCLQRSLSTLHRIVAFPDPVEGKTTHFSNLQGPLKEAMPRIKVIAESLKLAC